MSKRCGTCEHWCSYATMYEDPEEDIETGVCRNRWATINLESTNKYFGQVGIEDTCEQHEARGERS